MYIFGYNLPVTELTAVFSLILLVVIIILAYVIKKLIEMNKKVDELLDEGIILQKELNDARNEENKQIENIKEVLKKLIILNKIVDEENKQLAYMEELSKNINVLNKTIIEKNISKKSKK